ncbi:CLUMA_CG011807, isoform A [Clunio marinus]|uniref:CLUMA_CG011807, isoform A n=1 Tax=Clunio marinus TaxID=568069 RepID=A0A1J1IFC5_9DIPT|nr:CLUMA_CG011807, isoform A [Clunio marinus]
MKNMRFETSQQLQTILPLLSWKANEIKTKERNTKHHPAEKRRDEGRAHHDYSNLFNRIISQSSSANLVNVLIIIGLKFKPYPRQLIIETS